MTFDVLCIHVGTLGLANIVCSGCLTFTPPHLSPTHSVDIHVSIACTRDMSIGNCVRLAASRSLTRSFRELQRGVGLPSGFLPKSYHTSWLLRAWLHDKLGAKHLAVGAAGLDACHMRHAMSQPG